MTRQIFGMELVREFGLNSKIQVKKDRAARTNKKWTVLINKNHTLANAVSRDGKVVARMEIKDNLKHRSDEDVQVHMLGMMIGYFLGVKRG